LIECINIEGAVLDPFVIFKGKLQMKDWWDHFSCGHIAVSPKGWTTNELGVEWLKKCFNPESKKHQKGEYRLLIVDGHASHISTEAIRFCTENKIILLCEEAHTTHLCQPLDCGVFLPLSTQIKLGIQCRCRFNPTYSIDKCDFLEIYQQARKDAITPENVRGAWEKTGLYPFNPDVVISQLPRPTERPSTPLESTQLLALHTPLNTNDLQKLLEAQFSSIKLLDYIVKAAIKAMTDVIIEKAISRELL